MAPKTRSELLRENAELRETLESVYDELGEFLDGDGEEEEEGQDKD